ncbi:MAG: nucleotidyltransferase domain-containing protein [Anaerolineales bacterium]|nr:nucleotidyltransferase domain-containing protein [Anaerolineales bacterium]MDW8445895.1 nucleotidyltransferase domain-containing protein [Anaerolineales bacterium]
MAELFTTFARTRFVNREAVVEAIRQRAVAFCAWNPQAHRIFLIGSFATRTATPRSDLDLVVEVSPVLSREARFRLWEQAYDWFTVLPFVVDLFVLDSAQLQSHSGLAGVVQREGICLTATQ